MVQNFHRIQDYRQHTNLRLPERMEDFLIYDCGQLNSDARLALPAYRHQFYEITLDVNMGCDFQVDDFRFAGEKRALAVIGPSRLQSVYESQHAFRPGDGFSLFFHRDFLPGNLDRQYAFFQSTHSPLVRLDRKGADELLKIFGLINYEYTEYGPAARETIQSLTTALLTKVKHHATGHALVPATSYREVELARDFKSCVQENFLRLTTVKEYANLLHVSDKYLSQAVKNATGRNALEILSSARITYAKALLLHTNLSSVEVGYELNFATTDYFFTYFKKLTGQTPQQYRQENSK
ncbi:helix-turn-helix domain-containing protein [Hymenobacter terrenus]|uniref:helix-turn-helix domain-containing protein n=1 Tax=Hymenobacter terrenus TaxID=1629124 RepID=UPI000619EB9F|nr:AraC family transcriptional regulator [Hymenobacter terrenus]